MSKKKIIILIVVFIIVVMGVGVAIYSGIKSSKDNEEVMNNIKESYEVLEGNISSYNDARSNLLNVISKYYSNEMDEYYDKFVISLDDEEKVLEDIYVEVEKLDDLCLERLFKDSEVNNICNNYKVYYETVYNVYMNDINRVNEFINSYNQEYGMELGFYTSDVGSDYIDYNNDGVFVEREDINE